MNVARIVIPPLRDRPEDIEPLVEHILKRVERRHGWDALSLSREALAAIRERPWPGNVRQLENTIARAVIAARGRTILPEHLDVDESTDPAVVVAADAAGSMPLRALLAEVERRAIQRSLWSRAAAIAPKLQRSSASAAANSSTKFASMTFFPEPGYLPSIFATK